jgi:preprotein translocase subunit SecF
MTSITTALALIAIAIFGGAVLRDFALAMLWGVAIGTYSSVFIAVGIVSRFDLSRNDDDNSVPIPEYEREGKI